MQPLHIEAWVGDEWQRVVRLDGNKEFWPSSHGDTDTNQSQALEDFLKANPGMFWVETTVAPHGVLFGPGVPRLFRLSP
ncbi:hypothetical protein JL475_06385 [Streptomyces sp. M2CJ-2]|uniref:hypothetical protein n=1 Tax=Streptomyces sp. M2CJ-2 TaxID=2803948 RepID=UPI001924794B|nr:hypothetical protein [Streptomyces sp. M2CJ-2]MBL3665634.1 hypothetical protein [Streptomyces sp. M2CJ-2]